jgi:hypothetical protein
LIHFSIFSSACAALTIWFECSHDRLVHKILYVSPLYLRAEQGQLPELKRVIAAYGDQVVMKETLAAVRNSFCSDPSFSDCAAR